MLKKLLRQLDEKVTNAKALRQLMKYVVTV